MKFSKSKNGFFLEGVHAAAGIPGDAVDVSEADYFALLTAQSAGMNIVGDAAGYPVAIARPPADPAVVARSKLLGLDAASVRSIREWIAAQPTAPQRLKDYEAAAVAARANLV